MKTKYKFLISARRLYIDKTTVYDGGNVLHEYKKMFSGALYCKAKQFIWLKLSKAARIEKMKQETKEYMRQQWKENCPAQYQKYFNEWFDNITDWQLHCYNVWSHNKMGPF